MLTGRNCAPQCGDNDFKSFTTNMRPGLFMIAIAEKKVSLFTNLESQHYVLYTAAEKRALANRLQMEHATIPAFSVFAGDGHLQRAGAG